MSKEQRARSVGAPIIREAALRAYVTCPKLYKFGGKVFENPYTKLLRQSFEKIVIQAMSEGCLDPAMQYSSHIVQATKELEYHKVYLPQEVQKYQFKVAGLLTEVFKELPPNKFFPVAGVLPWRVKVSKSIVELNVSGIFRTRTNRTCHIVDFSPYQTMHNILNDPIAMLKTLTIAQVVNDLWTLHRDAVVMHVYSMDLHHHLRHAEIRSNALEDQIDIKDLEQVMYGIENNYFYPNLPCTRECPFRAKCTMRHV